MGSIPTLDGNIEQLVQIPGRCRGSRSRCCAFHPRCPRASGPCGRIRPVFAEAGSQTACWLLPRRAGRQRAAHDRRAAGQGRERQSHLRRLEAVAQSPDRKPAASAAGGSGKRELHHRPARNLRAGRRRLRQIDDRQDDRRPGGADHRQCRHRRRIDDRSGRRADDGSCAHQMVFQTPMPASIRAGAISSPSRCGLSPRQPSRWTSAPRSTALAARRPRSTDGAKYPRIFRRPAPADRDRARWQHGRTSSCATSRPQRSTCRCRRRSQPDAICRTGSASPTCHQPQSRGGAPHGEPHRRAISAAWSGGGRQGLVPRAATPLYAHAPTRCPASTRAGERARRSGAGPQSARSTQPLRLPSALQLRHGALPRRAAG